MCNCGNKRQALSRSNSAVEFKYTGNGSLNIRSGQGKQAYHFSTLNRRLMIKAEDVPAVRKFTELVEDRAGGVI
jgi:hypothetical protein